MKIQTSIKRVPACLMAVVLMAIGAAMTVQAAAPALQGQVTLRPLTPSEIKDYALTGAQGASGLSTVGKGQPAYLEALVNNAVTNSDITNIVWTLTVRPAGSAAALAASPLGTNVPTYKMADRYNNSGAAVYKVAGRTLLRPDVTGLYTVTVSIRSASSGSTNLTQNITAGTYVGVNTCALCHSGGALAPDKYTSWSQTPHATFFTRAIDGLESDHYGKNCISCHTVGYDTNTAAVNGGFDDVATQVGWTFPTNLIAGNWAAMPASLKNLGNIQCENCHGAGSEHAIGELTAPLSPAAKAAIAVTFDAGNCAQCHDSKNNHVKSAEWNNSLHARVTRTPSGGANRAQCARCHTGGGFAQYADTLGTTNIYTIVGADTTYTALTCATCHNPHDAANPHQLRAGPNIKLGDGTTVTNAGAGGFCMNCHQSRNGSVSNSIVKFPLGQQTWLGGSAFGVHDNPAGDMLEGVNGWTYGLDIPSSAHRFAVTDTCAGCHMNDHYSTNSASPAFTHVGGHSFNMSWSDGTNTYENVEACAKCHGPIDSFDMVKVDYNGDGVIEGVQTEVQKLLDKLSTLLPPANYVASGNYVADGLVKSPSARTNWQSKFLKAGYNWQFVNNDLSKGVHNAAYAVGLLKASIGDLTGDPNNDGLSDAWQLQYFGVNWASNPNAAPNATPAGDSVPNWLKYSLGLNPLDPWGTIPGGFVWGPTIPVGFVSGPSLANPQGTNTVEIYTAAEVAFNTQVGTTYQIQSSPSLNGNFENLGGSIAGTGGAISYLTPTRDTTNMFFRVVHTP
jgi:Doubled CXXCH motif (Paired_CXXCH_1)/Cytochrome c554 and c-prime